MSRPKVDPKRRKQAAELRRNQTDAESRLWHYLRVHQMKNIHFRRQHVIGPFIVDFCALGIKLVLELDGGQHLEQADDDARRTKYLESKGYRVLRFWDHEVFENIDGVWLVIFDAISPHQTSPENQGFLRNTHRRF
jgi:very-short-patch-repair endonuclease